MKVAITLLALIALAYSAPQPRKLFHEHFEDFVDIIIQEIGEQIGILEEEYVTFEEFQVSLDYLLTPNFRNLVYEMEDIPEFKAVIEYLETHDIDILYFVNAINGFVDGIQGRSLRQSASGRDVTAFIKDIIPLFPKEKLNALYEEKVAEDEDFKRAMESFETEEWDELFSALWLNETFLKEVDILNENGINVEILLVEVVAVFGLL